MSEKVRAGHGVVPLRRELGLAMAERRRYPTDVSDAQWELIAPVVPAAKPGGCPLVHSRREIVNALAYWVRSGCAWRLLPHDLPPWQTVYHYWRTWRLDGYDGGKRLPGVKRHLLVDTTGTVLCACVSPASVNDRDGAAVLLPRAHQVFPRLRVVWADQGYRGRDFHAWARQTLGIIIQILTRRDSGFRTTWAKDGAPPRQVPSFELVPHRWVVERTFAWLGKYRRQSKDYEYLTGTSTNVIYLAMSMILLHRHTGVPP